jgi:phosphoserine aminotransferase
MELVEHTISLLHSQLEIPPEYEVYFISSATEAWEIVAQSLVKEKSHHFYNGAFGQKWFEYTKRLKPGATAQNFDKNDSLLTSLGSEGAGAEVLCVTQNETSNGTQVMEAELAVLRQGFDGLLAVDATSSMGGVLLPWLCGDIWFASVQKCFGLPPGMGVLVVSPKAIEVAQKIGERDHYNSLLFIRDNFAKYQTPYTPNILGIYLLNRMLQSTESITSISQSIRTRALDWYTYFENSPWELLIENQEVRSDTVIAIQAERGIIQTIKSKANAEGISLGNGYGEWKPTSLRIANFPAITNEDFQMLRDFLDSVTIA